MSQHRPFDRRAAEALLGGGDPAARRPADEALAGLLAAASAAGHPSELAGETAALAAFRAAGRRRPVPVRHRATSRAVATRVLTVKIAAALAAATAGSVALAAATGMLPTPPGTPGSDRSAGAPTSASDPVASASRPVRRTIEPPAPSLVALCRAFTPEPARGRRMEAPPAAALVAAAGGRSAVEAYCATLLATEGPHGNGPDGSGPPGPNNEVPPDRPPTGLPPDAKPSGEGTPAVQTTAPDGKRAAGTTAPDIGLFRSHRLGPPTANPDDQLRRSVGSPPR